VFIFEIKSQGDLLPLARNVFKRARTIRFPDCIKFIDGIETDSQIIFATEASKPLLHEIKTVDEGFIRLGLFKIASALRFLNESCKLIHANLSANSVFVTNSGEWK
jgi:SCY1-like protein 1